MTVFGQVEQALMDYGEPPSYEDIDWVFNEFGYTLTQDIYDLIIYMDPENLTDDEVQTLMDIFGVQTLEELMTIMNDMMVALDDYMMEDGPDYDFMAGVFADLGYTLSQEAYDLMMQIEDPSVDTDLCQQFSDMLGLSSVDDLMTIMGQVEDAIMDYYDMDDEPPTYEELDAVFIDLGYTLTQDIYDLIINMDPDNMTPEDAQTLMDTYGVSTTEELTAIMNIMIMALEADDDESWTDEEYNQMYSDAEGYLMA